MISPLFIGGFNCRQVNGGSCLILEHKCEGDPNQGSRRHLFYILRRLLPNTISPAPKISRFSGSDNRLMGSAPDPIRSAKAPELSKGKITKTNIKVNKKAVLFTVPTPAFAIVHMPSVSRCLDPWLYILAMEMPTRSEGPKTRDDKNNC